MLLETREFPITRGRGAGGSCDAARALYSETLRGALLSIGNLGHYCREDLDIYNYFNGGVHCGWGK